MKQHSKEFEKEITLLGKQQVVQITYGDVVLTSEDINSNPYNIQFTEMKSLNIPQVQDDFDFVVITGSIVYNAGIDASTALAKETVLPHLVLQVVVREAIRIHNGQRISWQLTTAKSLKIILKKQIMKTDFSGFQMITSLINFRK